MSFTIKVKEEIIAASSKDKAELSALIKMSGSVGLTNQGLTLSISTENAKIARHIYQLMESRYQSNPELRHQQDQSQEKSCLHGFCR
jgi:DNA-binding protein WhiA